MARISTNEARDAYLAIQEEMPELTLDDLDPAMVEAGQQYARDFNAAWPPRPRTTGWHMRIVSSH